MWENFESIAALFKSIKKTLPIKGSADDELRVLQVAELSEGRTVIARHVIFRVQIARHFARSAPTVQQGDRADRSRKENNHKKDSQHNVASLSNIQNHEGL